MRNSNFSLDEALARLADRRGRTPDGLESGVWRKIVARRAAARPESIFDGWFATAFRPAGAFSTAVVTLVVAIGIGFLRIDGPGSTEAPASLGLTVFASDAPALPSTLISQSR